MVNSKWLIGKLLIVLTGPISRFDESLGKLIANDLWTIFR